MRYVINDDDLEDWYSLLHKVRCTISAGENEAHYILDYILLQMEIEMEQHPYAEGVTHEIYMKLLRSKYVKE